jgi:putative DNA primase/helicase
MLDITVINPDDLGLKKGEDVVDFVQRLQSGGLDDSAIKKSLTEALDNSKELSAEFWDLLEKENNNKSLSEIKERKLRSFPWTDSGAAEMLAFLYGDKLRYCYGIGWMYFNGKHWDKKRGEAMARTLFKSAARALRDEALNIEDLAERAAVEKYARSLEQSHKITATLKEAQHTAPFESYPDEFDSDAWAFNVQNGTIDLRTGKLRPHNPADMITYCAEVLYDENAKCCLWEKALLEIFQQNEVLIAYVQRIFGMCLTADVREQILIIFFGIGRNGKNLVLDTVTGVMSEYACEAASTLLVSQSGFEAHPTEVADLHGRRLIIACETRKDGVLKADTVKRLTGNARLKARFMRQDFFEFDRTFKIILCTNHRPEVPEDTVAIWGRLKVVPFNRIFSESEQDKTLLDKLKTEYSGILNWLIKGCLDWQKNGLQEPDEIGEAVGEYHDNQNPLYDFFNECCKFGPFCITPVNILKERFSKWEEETGRNLEISSQVFNRELREKGCEYDTRYYGGYTQKVWCGIDLR